MNRYETIIIFDADTASDERKSILERIESFITGQNGVVLAFDKWGSRKLAFPIRKRNQGFYFRVDYCGKGEIVDLIEQSIRHDQRILRFMTILQQSGIDASALKAQMAETAEAAETAAPVEAESAAPETAPTEHEGEE